MDYSQMKQEKEVRYDEYSKTYAEQLRLQGYISSLEKDNEHIRLTEAKGFFANMRLRKLIKINAKDIKMYNKWLSKMPEVPEFK